MKHYGIYWKNPEHCISRHLDVADCQLLLPKGKRIRNKKAKRRAHNKKARQQAKLEFNQP